MPVAMHSLGKMYNEGEGVGVDHAAAFKWFRSAVQAPADMSYPSEKAAFNLAAYEIAGMYEKGLGVEADLTKALMWHFIHASNTDSEILKEDSEKAIKRLATQVKSGQASEAGKLANACVDSGYADCAFPDTPPAITSVQSKVGEQVLEGPIIDISGKSLTRNSCMSGQAAC